jgi:RHS repeat-associated protein
MTDDGGYYQVSADVPIHNKVNGKWEEISEVDKSIKTAEDAENTVGEIATQSVSNPTKTGFYESEALTMYTNGDAEHMKIAGIDALKSDFNSCIYVKPNIITDKQVFINNATLTLEIDKKNTESNSNYIEVRQLEDELPNPDNPNDKKLGNAPLGVVDNTLFDKQYASKYNACKLDITAYAHNTSLGLYKNTGLALEPAKASTLIGVNSIILGIYYREIGDVDKTIESETVDLGRAGTLYVNDYTCSPLIVRDDLSVYDELAQVNIQTIINPSAIDNNASDGINTRTNYYSILQYENGEYYWKNCEGEYVFFIYSSDNNFVGSNSSGDKYILTSANDRTDYDRIKIKSEKDNTTYYFSSIESNGYVTKIEYVFTDENKKQYTNKVGIVYENSNISYITDGTRRKYKFNYDNNMLTSISIFYNNNGTQQPVKINNEDITIQYSYDENNRLEKVTYPDGYYVSYFYDTYGRIIQVIAYGSDNLNIAATELKLQYQTGSNKANVLSKYILKTNGVVSKEIEINSPIDNTYNRVFSDLLNKSEKIMHYDQDSNLIRYKNYDGQEYYLNYTNKELQHLIFDDSSSQNIITNGDFESNNNWTLTEGAAIVKDAPLKENGSTNNGVISFIANNKSGTATQTVNVTPEKSYVLSCSAYCKQALPFKNDRDNTRYYSVRVYGAVSDTLVGETYFDYNIVKNWQTSKCVITIPSTITKVKIEINSLNMPGECYFDDLEMYSATPDNSDDIRKKPIPNYEIVRNEYGQITDIIKTKNNDNKTIGKHYEYDDNTHYKSQVEEAGKTTYYNYDCGSGLLTSKGKNTDASKNTQYTYSGIGALTAVKQAITNANGDTVNQTVDYKYDTNDRVSSIYHNKFLYKFKYNKNGKLENVSVKESDDKTSKTDYSVSYEYNIDNVGKVTFGNGATIEYVYDGNNITKTIFDNGKSGNDNERYIYEYKYNDDGSVSEMKDNISGITTTYTEKGSVVTKDGKTIYSNTGSKINLFGTSLSYLQSTSTSKDKSKKTVKDNYTVSLTKGPIVKAETVLDPFDRTLSTSVENKGTTNTDTHYRLTSSTEYVDGKDNRQTNLVSHYTTELSKRSNKILPEKYENTRIAAEYYYNYDNVGRVTSVFKKSTNNITYAPTNKTSYSYNDGDLIHYYKYDEGGQVSLDVNLESKIATLYYYDEGGNISEKVTYSKISDRDYSYDYNSDTLIFTPKTNGETTKLYYKSNGMTDYLTSYKGNSIEYDAAGNPVKYAGTSINNELADGDMTWNGNLLTSFKTSSNLYKYTYDGDGKRTSKICYDSNGKDLVSEIVYIWDGDLITGYRAKFYDEAEDGNGTVLCYDKTIKIIYNNNEIVGVCVISNEGEPSKANKTANITEEGIETFGWKQSANYTFVKDGQGNITEIYDPSEKVVISMSYDAYGNITPTYMGTFIQDMANKYKPSDSVWADIIQRIAIALVVSLYLSGVFISVEQGFKGYIYDVETGLYYGQKRYYSPSWGRFINASDPTTLTENMSSVYNTNLFNYCGNDPVNNITKTGFNAPDQIISDAFVPQLVNSTNNLIKENRSTAKYFGEISTGLDTLSLGLRTTLDADAKYYWDKTLNKQKDVVENGYGLNYIETAINKDTSSVTKYSVDKQNTPYKVSKSID